MELVQVLLSDFNVRVLKEPRGFIKILQFFFTICSFATTTSFYAYLKLSITCDDEAEDTVTVPIYYNFQLFDIDFLTCSNTKTLSFRQNFSSDSSFFVAVGVLAFLYTLGALCLYTLFEKQYTADPRIPTMDFVVHCIFAVLFIAGSSAWANSLNSLKTAVDIDTIVTENPVACASNACKISESPNFSKLNISVILGFLNFFLFASNLWFIYKETTFFGNKEKNADQTVEGAEPGV